MVHSSQNVQGLGSFRIASINVNGLRTGGKLQELYEIIEKRKNRHSVITGDTCNWYGRNKISNWHVSKWSL